jgi:hypothetical protein
MGDRRVGQRASHGHRKRAADWDREPRTPRTYTLHSRGGTGGIALGGTANWTGVGGLRRNFLWSFLWHLWQALRWLLVRRPSCGPVAASRGHGGDRRSGNWRSTENNAIWVDQHELEELADPTKPATKISRQTFAFKIHQQNQRPKQRPPKPLATRRISMQTFALKDAVQPLAV